MKVAIGQVALRGLIALAVGASFMGPSSLASQTPRTSSPDVTFAIGGDLLGPYQPVSQLKSPGFEAVKAILNQADASFANFEASAFDLRTFEGWPASQNGGGTPLFPPASIADVSGWIDAVSVANNHSTDWGLEGMLATRKTLRDAGIATAGSGTSEDEARAPTYFTRGSTKIALVAAASTFTDLEIPSGPGVKDGMPTRARPGVNVLRTTEVRTAPRTAIEALRTLERRSGPPGRDDEIQVGGSRFRVGEAIGRSYQVNGQDEQKIVTSVADAEKNSQFVVFSIHAHETLSGDSEDPQPAAFQTALFHKVIDAGADVVFRHGPHAVGGIEIYKGRPILYGMGSLVFQFGGQRRLTWPSGFSMDLPDAWFESIAVTTRFRKGVLSELRIYPLMLESSKAPTDGLPSLAKGPDARRILERVQKASAQWGTKIDIRGDVGIVKLQEQAK